MDGANESTIPHFGARRIKDKPGCGSQGDTTVFGVFKSNGGVAKPYQTGRKATSQPTSCGRVALAA